MCGIIPKDSFNVLLWQCGMCP
uniref:Uncharacterized protein n=1 Tax=Rhizophora mucronata TaxID=61149 RepID=A0A2P2PV51_RHIMU